MAARQADRPRAPVIKERKPSPYELMKTAITTGEIAPGAPLVEAALAEWCQVSRTPVREALTRLEQDGLVIRSVRGLIVRERSPEEILDIYETRIALESTVARIAAARRTPIDLIHLRRAEEAMSKLEAGDENAMAAANREFHQALWRSSHNDSLIDLLSRLDLHLARYGRRPCPSRAAGTRSRRSTRKSSQRSRRRTSRWQKAWRASTSPRPVTSGWPFWRTASRKTGTDPSPAQARSRLTFGDLESLEVVSQQGGEPVEQVGELAVRRRGKGQHHRGQVNKEDDAERGEPSLSPGNGRRWCSAPGTSPGRSAPGRLAR